MSIPYIDKTCPKCGGKKKYSTLEGWSCRNADCEPISKEGVIDITIDRSLWDSPTVIDIGSVKIKICPNPKCEALNSEDDKTCWRCGENIKVTYLEGDEDEDEEST